LNPSSAFSEPRLSPDSIQISDVSYADPNGFVFFHQGGVYRAIRAGREGYYRALFEDGTAAECIERSGLAASEIVSGSIPDLNVRLLIRHKMIAPASHAPEWSPSMLKDAALMTLDLAIGLAGRGRTLQDANPWNVLFDGTDPRWIDLTSIVEAPSGMIWPAYQQFLNTFVHPLELMAMGKDRAARALMTDYVHGISQEEFTRHLTAGYSLKHPLRTLGLRIFDWASRRAQRNAAGRMRWKKAPAQVTAGRIDPELRLRFLRGLRARVEKINPSPDSKAFWKNYYADRGEAAADPASVDKAGWSAKQRNVADVLERLKPRRVTDLGSNTGWYSRLAARHAERVVAADSDAACADALYLTAKKEGSNILPLVMDVLNPTPSLGSVPDMFPSASDRIGGDLVLALALIHHLHITGRQSFVHIARALRRYGPSAIVEFVDPEDPMARDLGTGREVRYSLTDVVREFESVFGSVELLGSDVPTRRLMLCGVPRGGV
jgi:SAM-dependent methyltransferase